MNNKRLIVFIAAALLVLFSVTSNAEEAMHNDPSIRGDVMKLGIIIYTTDAETAWNAFRVGNFALQQGDDVKVFLLAKGVECEKLNEDQFKVAEQMQALIENGGKIFGCGKCLKLRHSKGTKLCPLSTMKDLYKIVKDSDRVITF